jgi:hypothetical protein
LDFRSLCIDDTLVKDSRRGWINDQVSSNAHWLTFKSYQPFCQKLHCVFTIYTHYLPLLLHK